jgi:hypothetical protein
VTALSSENVEMAQVAPVKDPDYWIELLAVILLSAATVTSTWCAYQSARWSGVQDNAYSMASTYRTEAARMTTIGSRKQGIDVGLFVQYAAAVSHRDTLFARMLSTHFRPEFEPAFKAWIATKPSENPLAPRSPFEMAEYQIAELRHAQDLSEQAEKSLELAGMANLTSDKYVLLTVLFAAVFFFAGIDSKLRSRQLRIIVLFAGIGVFLLAAGVEFTFPIK